MAGHNALGRLEELAGLGVTVLHGAQDAVVPSIRARELAAAIPDARSVLLERCGHMMTSDAEAATVLEHLDRHAAARLTRRDSA